MSETELDVALSAARDATILLRALLQDRARLRNGDALEPNPVTTADLAVRALVHRRLAPVLDDLPLVTAADAVTPPTSAALLDAIARTLRPTWPDVSAETLAELLARPVGATNSPAYWTLDVIDRTDTFVEPRHHTIGIAKVVAGRPVLGVLGCPLLSPEATVPTHQTGGVLLFDRNGAAWQRCLHHDAPDRKLSVDDAVPGPCVVTHSSEPHHSRIGDVHRVLEHTGRKWRAVPADGQLEYVLVARGDAHVYMRIPVRPDQLEAAWRHAPEAAWRHAPGIAIATAAGARVTDLHGRPLDFTESVGSRDNYGILVCEPALHAELLGALSSLGFDHP